MGERLPVELYIHGPIGKSLSVPSTPTVREWVILIIMMTPFSYKLYIYIC